jgi:hypothetical protein
MPRFSITGPDRMMVPGADPLDALLTVHHQLRDTTQRGWQGQNRRGW